MNDKVVELGRSKHPRRFTVNVSEALVSITFLRGFSPSVSDLELDRFR